jgi:hypothetical protein
VGEPFSGHDTVAKFGILGIVHLTVPFFYIFVINSPHIKAKRGDFVWVIPHLLNLATVS